MATYPIHGMLEKETRAGAPSVDSHLVGPHPENSNIGIGPKALGTVTTGSWNIALGREALMDLTTGIGNIAIGEQALSLSTTGEINIAIGALALTSSTTGRANLAIGYGAMVSLETGYDNVAVGDFAMSGYVGPNEGSNVAVGKHSMELLETGTQNTALGDDAGRAIGPITGSGNVLIGKNTNTSTEAGTDQIVIGRNVTGVGNSICTIGVGANTASLSLDGVDTSWAAASDERLKTDIADYEIGLSFIEDLRPITYHWRDSCRGAPGKRYTGFSAQQVKAVIDAHNMPNGQHLWGEHEDGVQTVAPAALIPILVNAVKELAAEVASLRGRLDANPAPDLMAQSIRT